MHQPLFAFPQPKPIAPPGASPLLGAILLAVECASSLADLAEWWQDHKPAIKRLPAPELAQAVAAKDLRKQTLAAVLPVWHPEEPQDQTWAEPP